MSSETPSSLPKFRLDQPPKGGLSKNLLVGIACVAGVQAAIDTWKSESRYPVRLEYELAKACISSSNGLLSRNLFKAKEDQCLCALEDAMQKYPYDKFRKSEEGFYPVFQQKAASCAKKGQP